MTYRSDVQILRGLAVLLVVLFHLEIPAFSSGFLGVDVFFVISGYLMAVLFDAKAPGQFYLRRARRLLPAYFATVLATVIAVTLVTTPNELYQLFRQVGNALGFTSNIGFWARDSYWAKDDFKPLLHLWSLAVEIQFYALVPLVAWLVRRAGLSGLILLASASALLCFSLSASDPKAAFFLLPSRIWEFLIGYGTGIAFGARPLGGRYAQRLGVASLVAIALIALLPLREGGGFLSGHPGLAALAITTATAAVIASGLPSALTRAVPGRLLERLGDWSYAIYLAHFPVIVLMLYTPFGGTVTQSQTAWQLASVVVAVAIASFLLYRLVEQPLRKVNPGWPGLVGAVAVILGVTLVAPLLQSSRLSRDEHPIFASLSDRDTWRCGPTWQILHPRSATCPLNEPAASRGSVLLVGNSYADSLKQVLTNIASSHDQQVYLTAENLPLMPGGHLRVDDIIREAEALQARAIVLHYSADAIDETTVTAVAQAAESRGIVTRFIMPVPRQQTNVPRALLNALHSGEPPPRVSLDDYRQQHAARLTRLRQVPVPSFRVYEIAQDLCRPRCEITAADGTLFYYDEHHLTLTGSRQLEPTLERLLADVASAQPPAQAGVRPPGRHPDAQAASS